MRRSSDTRADDFEIRQRAHARQHEKKAAVAVAHTLICIAWAVLSRGQDYAEAGEDYYEQRDRRDREHLIRHH